MKNFTKTKMLYLSIILLLFAVFQSCDKKFEDGPLISLKSKNARLVGVSWKLKQLKTDGIDSTFYIQDICGNGFFIFNEEDSDNNDGQKFQSCMYVNSIRFFVGVPSYWNWFSDNQIQIVQTSGSSNGFGPIGRDGTFTWKITRLKSSELWMNTDYNGRHYELKLESI